MTTSAGRFASVRADLMLIWCIVGVALGVALALALPSDNSSVDASLVGSGITLPSWRLTPDDVVRLQLDSLQAFRDNDAALIQCFVLASPLNRAATGPLPRFAAMVRNPHYLALVDYESVLVGKAVVRGDHATVLVTVIDALHRPSLYRFFLSKQSGIAYRGCWMTDAVVTDKASIPPPEPPPPTVQWPGLFGERLSYRSLHAERVGG
jgi:hypothetical protein